MFSWCSGSENSQANLQIEALSSVTRLGPSGLTQPIAVCQPRFRSVRRRLIPCNSASGRPILPLCRISGVLCQLKRPNSESSPASW